MGAMRYLYVLLFAFCSSTVWSDCSTVDPSQAYCSPITVFYEADPSGIGRYVRFSGLFYPQDQISELNGFVRWAVDGVVLGETGAYKSFEFGLSSPFVTVLLVNDLELRLRELGVVLRPDMVVTAEYVGDAFYTGQDSLCGQPGQPVCVAAFRATERFGDLQPFRIPSEWDQVRWNTTIEADKNTVYFAETAEVTVSWESDPLGDGLTGPFYLFDGDDLIASSFIDFGGYQHRVAVSLSTLPPGDYAFNAMFVGFSGALNVVNNQTVTIAPPRLALLLTVDPANPVMRAGAAGMPRACAKTVDDTRPPELAGIAVEIDILTAETNESSAVLVTEQTVALGDDGCAAIVTSGLVPGRYTIAARIPETATSLPASAGGPLTIVADDASTAISSDPYVIAGTVESSMTLIAPATGRVRTSQAPANSYEAFSTPLAFQAEIAGPAGLRPPTGSIRLHVNGQRVSEQVIGSAGTGLVTFPEISLSPGRYTATLVYSGDYLYSQQRHAPIELDVPVGSAAVFSGQSGLARPRLNVGDAFALELAIDANNVIDGQPVILSAYFRLTDNAFPRGVPSGWMVFRDGAAELGTVPVAGYSGAIRLPQGLPAGIRNLRVEFEQ